MSGDSFSCVARDAPPATDEHAVRFECTRQDDCHAGDRCFYSNDPSFGKATACGTWSAAYVPNLVCDPEGPSPCRGDPGCTKDMTCVPQEKGLKWMGVFAHP
jgi:hypothetical protein